MKRQFKGVWIPAAVMMDATLTAVDKIVLADIDSFSSREATFFKSNQTIATECGVGVSTIKRSIAKLIKRGYVEQVSFDGRVRHLRSTGAIHDLQTDHVAPSDSPKTPQQEVQLAPLVIQPTEQPTLTVERVDFGALDTQDFRAAWEHWKSYKLIEHRFKFKSKVTEQVALNKLITDARQDPDTAISAITNSIANGWKGIFIKRGDVTHRDRPADPNATLGWAER